ncbi:MAG: hypothetical protein F7C08_03990 [Desulfurococcales archaeon]|nr:hypothetical protein [Desulfurococcales archaeon]MCE4605674.1 hypothetical protein [Desulfurococcales archaeon]
MTKNSKVMIIPILAAVLLSSLGTAFYINGPLGTSTISEASYPMTLSAQTFNSTFQPDDVFTRGETVYIMVNLTYPLVDSYYANATPLTAYIVVTVYMPFYTSLTYITITTVDPGETFTTFIPFLILGSFPTGTYEVDIIVLDRMPGDPGATLLANPVTITFTVVS